jgi:capsule polysaccharide export protein KpsE/RkpR
MRLSRFTKVIIAGVLVYMFSNTAMSVFASSSITVHSTKLYTVQVGDTLWQIAGESRPNDDPYQVIDWLRKANHMSDVMIQPGQTLLVPMGVN